MWASVREGGGGGRVVSDLEQQRAAVQPVAPRVRRVIALPAPTTNHRHANNTPVLSRHRQPEAIWPRNYEFIDRF